MSIANNAAILLIAMPLEFIIGYPDFLVKKIGHPVMWFGKFIELFDNNFNKGTDKQKRFKGFVLALLLLLLGFAFGSIIEAFIKAIIPNHILQMILIAFIATSAFAQNSLYWHVKNVEKPLLAGDIESARIEVSKIVGRDTKELDEDGIASAAIETLAESFCDGIIAPIFWFFLGGLGGAFAFKAISTADSMVGHKDEKYEFFGFASAKIDDALNYIPARLGALLICIIGSDFKIMWRDKYNHASPNSAWCEAAMAGALGVKLGGGAFYDGEFIARPSLGDGDKPDASKIKSALSIYLRACLLQYALIGVLLWLL